MTAEALRRLAYLLDALNKATKDEGLRLVAGRDGGLQVWDVQDGEAEHIATIIYSDGLEAYRTEGYL